MKTFINKAVGVPFQDRGRDFSGWDCWGLVVCLYRDVFQVRLPSFEEISCVGTSAIRAMQEVARQGIPVPAGQERPGDVALWRPAHAGVVVGSGKMLHCRCETSTTCIERYDNAIWRQRLIGFYRHVSLA